MHDKAGNGADAPVGARRIVIIGAGPGGICAGVKLREAGIDDFVILEKGTGPGGTWYHNRYPGAECDVRSHLYSFSFEPNPDWSKAYAGHAEIRAYFERCVEKYGIGPFIRYGKEVTSADWDDARGIWRLSTKAGEIVEADVVISAIGMFNELSWPDIEGLRDFGGTLFHSARWRYDHDLNGRTVGVIGSAASAVQFVPEIAKEAGQLHLFQRTPNWVIPKANTPFTEEELARLRADPREVAALRETIYGELENFITFSNPDALREAEAAGLANLEQVKDPEVRAKLRPTGPFGCQRPLLSDDFYPTFNRPNVELVTERIARVTRDGIVTSDGRERKVDTIICATGFKANQYLSVLKVRGRNGVDLQQAWNTGPIAYLGVATAGFPNLFMLYGPNTNNGSILFMIECQVAYAVRQIQRMSAERIKWLDVRPDVMARYNDELQKAIDKVAVWQVPGSNYYRAPSGRIVTQWPYTMAEYRARTEAADSDAYEAMRLAS
jgi:cation diffusion facilitator CzcD-associated flavoprotein CzcO